MATRRQILIWATASFGFAALVAFLVPLIGSFKPSGRAGASLPRFDISDVEPGSFRYVDSRPPGGWNHDQISATYLVVRTLSDKLYIYEIPIIDGEIRMPDVFWWQWGPVCTDFGPDAQNGSVSDDAVITCNDPNVMRLSEWYRRELRWTVDGTNLGDRTENMVVPKYAVEGKYLVIGKS